VKIYYTCECCGRIFKSSEIEGQSGIVEIFDLCQECAEEIGIAQVQNQGGGQRFYN